MRLREPLLEVRATERKRVLNHRCVPRDPRAHRAAARKNHHPSNRASLPPESFPSDDRGQTRLFVELAQRFLERGYVRFHLDREHDPRVRMPGKNVERPAFTVLRVRHLQLNVPAQVAQACSCRGHECGMCLVEQSIECGTSPSDFENETSVK